jgi:TPR repeat protein
MHSMGSIHGVREEHAQAVEWYTQGAEAGLPAASSA